VRRLPTHIPAPRRLVDHDVVSLGRWLALCTAGRGGNAGPSPAQQKRGERAAAKALRHALALDERRDAPWSDAALSGAGIGRWARGHLLELSPGIGLEVAERAPSGDGSERLLLRAQDGALIESVIIPAEEGRDRARTTLCLSSQVGCARACTFCETGVQGLERQLTAGEIVDQLRLARRLCASGDRPVDRRGGLAGSGAAISNVVFMGMGEPFDNLREVVRAIALITDPHGFGLAPSRITVSTVGVADRFAEFFASTRAELAISLNAPDDARRRRIMPVTERFDLAELRRALLDALPAKRRVLFQYAIFGGFNDALEDADLVASYVRGIACRVNVIVANAGPDPTLAAPSDERIDAFVARLRAEGVTTMVRRPRGRDVGGACGQLAGRRRLSANQGGVELGACP
jgi:23S rRNA (adenine2503-C2)-methyltransferase